MKVSALGAWLVIAISACSDSQRGENAPATTEAPAPEAGYVSPAERQRRLREYREFARRSCATQPDSVERLSGTRMTRRRRERSVQICLEEMRQGEAEILHGPLIP